MGELTVQYVSDEQGKVTGVIVPIAVWEEIASELETSYLTQVVTYKRCV